MGISVMHMDRYSVSDILGAILQLMPLDNYVEHPVFFMEAVPGNPIEPVIWDTYKDILRAYGNRKPYKIICITKWYAFYKRAKKPFVSYPHRNQLSMPTSFLRKELSSKSGTRE